MASSTSTVSPSATDCPGATSSFATVAGIGAIIASARAVFLRVPGDWPLSTSNTATWPLTDTHRVSPESATATCHRSVPLLTRYNPGVASVTVYEASPIRT